MTLYDIKPRFQDLLRALVRVFFIRGVTANQVTVSAAIFSVVLGAVLMSWLTEFGGVIVQTLTGCRNYRGPMGKSDRAFVLGALGLFIALWPQYVLIANIVLGISAVLLAWTSINRCRSALEVINA